MRTPTRDEGCALWDDEDAKEVADAEQDDSDRQLGKQEEDGHCRLDEDLRGEEDGGRRLVRRPNKARAGRRPRQLFPLGRTYLLAVTIWKGAREDRQGRQFCTDETGRRGRAARRQLEEAGGGARLGRAARRVGALPPAPPCASPRSRPLQLARGMPPPSRTRPSCRWQTYHDAALQVGRAAEAEKGRRVSSSAQDRPRQTNERAGSAAGRRTSR